MSTPGKLRPPYPRDTCVGEGCGKALTDDVAAYLFSDLDTGKLAVLCEGMHGGAGTRQGLHFVAAGDAVTAPDPLSVICPLCAALPGEDCPSALVWIFGDEFKALVHVERVEDARRVQALNAEPTAPL